MLAPARSRVPRPDLVPARRADEGADPRARRRPRASRPHDAPRARRRASSPATTTAPSSSGTGSTGERRRSSTRAGASSARTTASGASRPASAAGSASPRPSRSTRSGPTPARTRVVVGPRASLARRASRPAGGCYVAGRPGRGEAPLPLAGGRARASSRRRAASGSQLDEPAYGVAPRTGRRPLRRRRRGRVRPDHVRCGHLRSRRCCRIHRLERPRRPRPRGLPVAVGLALGWALPAARRNLRAAFVVHQGHGARAPAGDQQDRGIGRSGERAARQGRSGTDSAVDAVDSVDTAVRAVSFAVKRPVQKLAGLAAGVSHGCRRCRTSATGASAVDSGQGGRRAARGGSRGGVATAWKRRP